MLCYIYPNEANTKLFRILQRMYLDSSFDMLTRNVGMTVGVNHFGSDEHLSDSAKVLLEVIHSSILHHVFLACTNQQAVMFVKQAAYGHLFDQMTIPLTYLAEVKNKLRELASIYGQDHTDTGDCEDHIYATLHTYMDTRYRNNLNDFNTVLFELMEMFREKSPGPDIHAYRFTVTANMHPQVFCTFTPQQTTHQQYESICFPG